MTLNNHKEDGLARSGFRAVENDPSRERMRPLQRHAGFDDARFFGCDQFKLPPRVFVVEANGGDGRHIRDEKIGGISLPQANSMMLLWACSR